MSNNISMLAIALLSTLGACGGSSTPADVPAGLAQTAAAQAADPAAQAAAGDDELQQSDMQQSDIQQSDPQAGTRTAATSVAVLPAARRAMWSWYDGDIGTSARQRAMLEFAVDHGVRIIYLHSESLLTRQPALLAGFLNRAAAYGVSVELLFGASEWMLAANHPYVLNLVAKANAFTAGLSGARPAGLHFRAGQHIRMTVLNPSEIDAEGDKRFFTMASTPQEPDLVFAWRVRDTAFKRIVGHLQPGEKVLIQKRLGEAPQGSFVLHNDATTPAVFLAGGIGIIPAYAMIKDALQRGLGHPVYLFYANRRPEDAPYLAELEAIAGKNPQVHIIATMTEPEKSAQAWNGETGFITRAMIEKYVRDTQDPIYYVSGLPAMVKAMQRVLAELEVNKNHIRAEEFDGFKMGEGAHGAAPTPGRKTMQNNTINQTAASATLHCLTGCAIGEIIGLVVGEALRWTNLQTIALSIVLAFLFGYSLSIWPLLKAHMALGAALTLVLAADTLSIATMEIFDNLVMATIPGAMEAGLVNPIFWISMTLAMAAAFVAAFPVNRYLLQRGQGHALMHKHHK